MLFPFGLETVLEGLSATVAAVGLCVVGGVL